MDQHEYLHDTNTINQGLELFTCFQKETNDQSNEEEKQIDQVSDVNEVKYCYCKRQTSGCSNSACMLVEYLAVCYRCSVKIQLQKPRKFATIIQSKYSCKFHIISIQLPPHLPMILQFPQISCLVFLAGDPKLLYMTSRGSASNKYMISQVRIFIAGKNLQ